MTVSKEEKICVKFCLILEEQVYRLMICRKTAVLLSLWVEYKSFECYPHIICDKISAEDFENSVCPLSCRIVGGPEEVRQIIHYDRRLKVNDVLRRLREDIRKRCPQKWFTHACALHCNYAPAYTALWVQQFLVEGTWPWSPTPYSHDLAFSDFLPFPQMRIQWMDEDLQASQRFRLNGMRCWAASRNGSSTGASGSGTGAGSVRCVHSEGEYFKEDNTALWIRQA
jgi:hypothetical protein